MPRQIPPAELKQILREHLHLGAHKPVSYLPLNTVQAICGLSVEDYCALARQHGLQHLVLGPDESCVWSGAVYVYDAEALQNVLAVHHARIQECRWPEDPSGFLARLAGEWLNPDDKMMAVVKAAFGDDKRACDG